MKRINCLLCFLLFTMLCYGQQNKATVTIDLDTLKAPVLFVKTLTGEEMEVAPGKNGKFVFQVNEGIPGEVTIRTKVSKGTTVFYLEKGDDLHIKTNFDRKATFFSGKGKENNEVLNESEIKYYQKLSENEKSMDPAHPDPEKFLQGQVDAVNPMQETLRAHRSEVSPVFYEYFDLYTKIRKLAIYQYYGTVITYIPDTSAFHRKPSQVFTAKYLALGRALPVNNKLLRYSIYKLFMADNYPKFLLHEKRAAEGLLDSAINSTESGQQKYKLVDRYYSGKLRSEVLGMLLQKILDGSKNAAAFRALVDDYIARYAGNDEKRLIEEAYQKALKLSAGQVPPLFELSSLDGDKVSLKDFAGKVVYIDFWASWCGPCRGEMKNGAPKLHEQFKDNKDVVFLYISIDDSEEKWKKAIEEDKIEGIHLLSTGGTNSVVAKAFNISGIPRYVLIGRDGKILDNNATRPSQPETVQKIHAALGI